MSKKWSTLAIAVGALAMSSATFAAPSPEMLANACGGCHGTNGGSAGDAMPSLASQSEPSFVEAMTKFKNGERPSTIMGRLAKGYSDDEIKAMAGFFAKQKLYVTTQKLDKKKVALGAKLQEKNCSRCHLDEGKDGKDDTPVMASQWLPYLQIQMDLYASGARKMPDKMAEKVKGLSKDELDALIQFYAAQK